MIQNFAHKYYTPDTQIINEFSRLSGEYNLGQGQVLLIKYNQNQQRLNGAQSFRKKVKIAQEMHIHYLNMLQDVL